MELKQVKTNKRFFNKAQNLRNIIAIVEEYKIKNPLFGTYKNLIEEIEKKEQEEQDAEKAADDYFLKNHEYYYNNSEIAENYDKLKSIANSKYHELIKLKELKKEAAKSFIDNNITLELFMLINSNRAIKRLSKIFGEHLDGFLLEALREYGQNGGFSGGIIECNAEIKNKFKKADYYEHYVNEYNNGINENNKEIENLNKLIDCFLAHSLLDEYIKKSLYDEYIGRIESIEKQSQERQESINRLMKELEQSKIAVNEFNAKKAEFLKAYDFFGITLEQPKVKQATNDDFTFNFDDEIKQEPKKSNKNRL